MVLDRGQRAQPERDHVFEKATWDLQATPVLGIAALVLAIAALTGLIRKLITRLSRTRCCS